MKEAYYRIHHEDCPAFSPENASSAPWGEEEQPCPRCKGTGWLGETECPRCEGAGVVEAERVPGYSACESAALLVEYFERRGGAPEDAPVVIFRGRVVGWGPDNEPLVIPEMRPRPRWTTYGALRRTVERRI